MRKSQRFGIGTSVRPSMVAQSVSMVPGPGNYESSLADKRKSPIFGFGSSKRKEMGKTFAPGPGQY